MNDAAAPDSSAASQAAQPELSRQLYDRRSHGVPTNTKKYNELNTRMAKEKEHTAASN
jgi:hypothetical protein